MSNSKNFMRRSRVQLWLLRAQLFPKCTKMCAIAYYIEHSHIVLERTVTFAHTF